MGKVNTIELMEARMGRIHFLDSAKYLLERYDVVVHMDTKNNKQKVVVLNRATDETLKYTDTKTKHQITAIAKQLVFVKSWLKACDAVVSKEGKKNQYGYDETVWRLGFAPQTRAIYDALLQVLTEHPSTDMTTDELETAVGALCRNAHAEDIIHYLLDKSNKEYDWQAYNVIEILLCESKRKDIHLVYPDNESKMAR